MVGKNNLPEILVVWQHTWMIEYQGNITSIGSLVNFTHQDVALPETNIKFAPENGWLEDDPFLLRWLILKGWHFSR